MNSDSFVLNAVSSDAGREMSSSVTDSDPKTTRVRRDCGSVSDFACSIRRGLIATVVNKKMIPTAKSVFLFGIRIT